jgi:uncharacterized Fe-S cluster protein YjdI
MASDKTHFSGGRSYRNKDITVYWKPLACIHASYCYRELIEVFDPNRRPWVDMDGSTTAKIIDVVNLCPTEALTWKWNEEEKNNDIDHGQLNHIKFKRPELLAFKEEESREKEYPTSIKIMIDGPVVLKGNFTLNYSGNSKDFKDGIISICRCGASDHQPFCDGRHRKIGFEDK